MRKPLGLFAAALALSPALALTLPAASAHAASFDCGKARAADEKAICRTLSLNDQDVRMAQLYDITRHFVGMGERGAIMDDQAAWLKARHDCGARTACLARAYQNRIEALNKVMDRAYSHAPF